MLILFVLLQATAPTPASACPDPDRLPAAVAARRCAGVALSNQARWREAAGLFEGAAKDVKGADAAGLWTQAGNAWLAAGEPVRAGTALDSALVLSADRPSAVRGALLIDRARAAVAAGDLDAARATLDQAVKLVPADADAWLLSATLARRMGQPGRAATDIAAALTRAPEDAAVQLEAGNIAALAGDADRARERWEEAARLDRDGASGTAARGALAQFGR